MNFTITELALVSYSPQRRKSILSDLTTKPTLWGSLWQGIMIQLGTSRKVLLSRGGRVGGGILPRGGSGVLGRPEEMDKNVQAIQVVKTESVFRMAPTQAIQTTKLGAAVQDLAIKEEKLVKVTAGARSGIQSIFGIITSVLNGVDHTIDWIYKCFRGKDQALDLTSKAKEIFSSAEQLKSTAVTDLITTSKRAQHTAQEKAIELVGEKNMDGVVGNVVATGKVVKGGSRWLRDGYHKMMAKRWAGDEFEMVVPRRRMDEKAIRGEWAKVLLEAEALLVSVESARSRHCSCDHSSYCLHHWFLYRRSLWTSTTKHSIDNGSFRKVAYGIGYVQSGIGTEGESDG